MWTLFWDMHSGGGQKEKASHIYIEAPEEEAKVVFYKKFGHNPERVTCTCCGPDYSIDESKTLEQASGYHRNCRSLETPIDPQTGRYKNDDSIIKDHYYLEEGEEPPKGYSLSKYPRFGKYQSLSDYIKNDNVIVIYEKNIPPEWRKGDVPDQGYVWVD